MAMEERKTNAEFMALFTDMQKICHDFKTVLVAFVDTAGRRGHPECQRVWSEAMKTSEAFSLSWKRSAEWAGTYWTLVNQNHKSKDEVDAAFRNSVKYAQEALDAERKLFGALESFVDPDTYSETRSS